MEKQTDVNGENTGMNWKRGLVVGIVIATLLALTGMYFLYDYNYGTKPSVVFNVGTIEKYTELTLEDVKKLFVSTDSDLDTVSIKDGEKLVAFDTVLMDENRVIVVSSTYRKSTVHHEVELIVKDSVLPTIDVQYDGKVIKENETVAVYAKDYAKDLFAIKAGDLRNKKVVPLEFTLSEGKTIPDDVTPGSYPVEVLVSDGTNQVKFNFTIEVKEEEGAEEAKPNTHEKPGNTENNSASQESGSESSSGVVDTPSTEGNAEGSSSAREPYIDYELTDSLVADLNLLREMNGLPPLVHDSYIHSLAVPRTYDRWAAQTVLHDGVPEGYAENLLIGNISDRSRLTSSLMVGAWDDSPGHRANILDPRWTITGVAVLVVEEWSSEWNKMTYSFMAVQLFQ